MNNLLTSIRVYFSFENKKRLTEKMREKLCELNRITYSNDADRLDYLKLKEEWKKRSSNTAEPPFCVFNSYEK